MDAAIAQLIQSLAKSAEELAVARVDAADKGAHLKYAELTGRIETMRTVISFFQQTAQAATPTPTPEPQTGENPPKAKKARKAS